VFKKMKKVEDFFDLPPVSTTPVVHHKLRISLRIFENNSKGSYWDTLGLGETLIHEKT
jgi:hypothetical protein